jgi:hypothetical protein
MYFLGSANRTRGHYEKEEGCFRYATIDFIFSEPTLILMGAWLQIN